MITVKDFLEKITNPDRIKIVKGEEVRNGCRCTYSGAH